jgi:hypothetical protein
MSIQELGPGFIICKTEQKLNNKFMLLNELKLRFCGIVVGRKIGQTRLYGKTKF